MATTTVKASGGGNDGGSILHAGNIASTRWNNITLAENATDFPQPHVVQAVSPNSSGNLGTLKAISAGNFGQMEAGQYVAKIIGTKIAGQTNTFLRSGAADTGTRRPIHFARGNRRYSLTDVSALSGVVTYGGSDAAFTYVDPETGSAVNNEPMPTDAVPGKLVYMHTGANPTQDTYSARTGV